MALLLGAVSLRGWLCLREQYPAMAKDFLHYVYQCHPKPGELLE
ncbi:hypothetical protein BH11PLA2_BH11PLA2_18990 [soil metagenome]